MSTTTIRLTKELKDKVSRAAERAGTTPHGFILEAIAEKADLEERRAGFIDSAEQRYAGILRSGKTVSWVEMRQYLERRLIAMVTEVTSFHSTTTRARRFRHPSLSSATSRRSW